MMTVLGFLGGIVVVLIAIDPRPPVLPVGHHRHRRRAGKKILIRYEDREKRYHYSSLDLRMVLLLFTPLAVEKLRSEECQKGHFHSHDFICNL